MMKLNRFMGNVCKVTSPYNIHGKLQAIVRSFLSGLISTIAQVAFITAKIAFIFTKSLLFVS